MKYLVGAIRHKYLKLLSLTLALGSQISLAVGEKVQPLPPSTVIKGSAASVNDAVEKMWGTEAYESPDPSHYQTGVGNVTSIEKTAIKEFIAKNSSGHIYIARYGMSDPELVQILKSAIKKGLSISLIVDLNRALEAGSDAKAPRSDFENMARMRNEMAKGIEELLAAGCKFNTGKCRILSQPVFPRANDEMIDILHDKALLLVSNEGATNEHIEFFHGTANFSDLTRINTLMKVRDQTAAKHYLTVLKALASTFEKGGTIRDIPPMAPLKVEYADGSFMELASTFGRYNTNDRIQQLFTRATQDPTLKIEAVYMNHFVVTHRPTVEALVEAMKAQKEFRVRGLVDDQFIEQGSQGLAGTLEGFDVFRKWGGPVVGHGFEINSRVDLFAYQAQGMNLITGKVLDETDPEESHAQKKLQHNKTTVVFVNEGGKQWAYVFFGSFNLSGHFQNSEFQMMLKVPADSYIALHAKWDFDNITRTQPENALPMGKAVVRNLIADYSDQSDQVVSLVDIKRAEDAILKRNYAELFSLIREVHARKSTMVKRKTSAELNAAIQDMEEYLRWYAANTTPSELGDYYRLRKFVSLMYVKENSHLDAWNLEKALRGALWRPQIDQAELDRLVSESWRILKFPGIPSYESRRARDAATAVTLPALSVGMSWIFDWDDNIAFMPTKVYVYHKTTGAEVAITTQQFAEIRDSIKSGTGEWGQFELRKDKVTGSFRRFESGIDGNFFLEDLASMVEGPEFEKRKGPAWNRMVEALSTEYSAKQFFILTARSNLPEEIFEGLQYLHKKGFIKFLPPKANIYSAQDPANPSAAKAAKFVEHLDRQSRTVVSASAPKVLDRDGVNQAQTHLVGYSDDDWGNFEAVMNAAVAGVKSNKWRNIKIVLKYTGRDARGANMRSVVIKSDGSLRPSIECENSAFRIHLMGCEAPLSTPKTAA